LIDLNGSKKTLLIVVGLLVCTTPVVILGGDSGCGYLK
jgi:hypothetical protein